MNCFDIELVNYYLILMRRSEVVYVCNNAKKQDRLRFLFVEFLYNDNRDRELTFDTL